MSRWLPLALGVLAGLASVVLWFEGYPFWSAVVDVLAKVVEKRRFLCR